MKTDIGMEAGSDALQQDFAGVGVEMDLSCVVPTNILIYYLDGLHLQEFKHEFDVLSSHSVLLGNRRKHMSPTEHLSDQRMSFASQSHESVDQQFHGVDAVAGNDVKVF